MCLKTSLAALLLALVLPLALIGVEMDRRSEPPAARVTVGEQSVDGELGSYVWGGLAVDKGLSVPSDVLFAAPGDTLQFAVDAGALAEAALSIYRAADIPKPGLTPAKELALATSELTWEVDLEPGRYVMALFVVWEGRGDASYFFALHVER